MPQISATLTTDTILEVKKYAKTDNRTFSQEVEILLQRAIKERNRKTITKPKN